MSNLARRTIELIHDYEEGGRCPACGQPLLPDEVDDTRAVGHGEVCFIPLARAAVFLSDRERIRVQEPMP